MSLGFAKRRAMEQKAFSVLVFIIILTNATAIEIRFLET